MDDIGFDGGAYGLNIFRKLITDALTILRPGGSLAFEIGAGQERLVSRLLQGPGGYRDIQQHRHVTGTVRVFSAVKA